MIYNIKELTDENIKLSNKVIKEKIENAKIDKFIRFGIVKIELKRTT